jgi:hypothetical protein
MDPHISFLNVLSEDSDVATPLPSARDSRDILNAVLRPLGSEQTVFYIHWVNRIFLHFYEYPFLKKTLMQYS